MTKLYLVTGFLGAGKTTFLKKFIPSLAPLRIHIIVNEFGKESIDGPLLETLETSLKQINNGSIFCTCKINDFEDALISALKDTPDYIIIESSGLADPTPLRSIIDSLKFKDYLAYSGTICLVDAIRFNKVYSTVRCVKKQLASSDLVLINKSDLASAEQLHLTKQLIASQRPDLPLYPTTFSNFKPEWISNLVFSEAETIHYQSTIPDITLQKCVVNVSSNTTQKQLIYFLKAIAEDTFRIKGFIEIENRIHLVNCVGTMIQIEPYTDANATQIGNLIVLSGSGLPIRKSLAIAINQYSHLFSLTQ